MTRALAASLGLKVLELDALRHQPGWVPMPDEECRSRVAAFTAGERWIVDGNNREQLRNIFRLDDRNIVRYAWTSQGERRARFEEGLVGLDAELARLRTPTAVKAFLRGVQEGGE